MASAKPVSIPQTTDLAEFATALGVDVSKYRNALATVDRMKATHAAANAKVESLVKPKDADSEYDPAKAMLIGEWQPGGPAGSAALTAAYEQRAVARRAIELAERELATIRMEISAAICEKLRPTWRRLVADVAAALSSLKGKLAAEREFTLALRDAEVMTGASWHNIPRIIEVDTIDAWLDEVRRDGNL